MWCRYPPVQGRTCCSSRPPSFLAAWKHSSTARREPGGPGRLGDLDADGCAGRAVGDLTGDGRTAVGRHPPVAGRRVGVEDQGGGQLDRGPVADSRPLGPVAAGQPRPGITGCFSDEPINAPDPGQGLDLLGLRHGGDVSDVELPERAAKAPVPPVGLVRALSRWLMTWVDLRVDPVGGVPGESRSPLYEGHRCRPEPSPTVRGCITASRCRSARPGSSCSSAVSSSLRDGPPLVGEVRPGLRPRVASPSAPARGQRHPEEVFLKTNGERRYWRRALDRNGTAPGILGQNRRDTAAAWRFLRRLPKNTSVVPRVVVTGSLRSPGAAHREGMPSVEHRQPKYLNNRAENSRRPAHRPSEHAPGPHAHHAPTPPRPVRQSHTHQRDNAGFKYRVHRTGRAPRGWHRPGRSVEPCRPGW